MNKYSEEEENANPLNLNTWGRISSLYIDLNAYPNSEDRMLDVEQNGNSGEASSRDNNGRIFPQFIDLNVYQCSNGCMSEEEYANPEEVSSRNDIGRISPRNIDSSVYPFIDEHMSDEEENANPGEVSTTESNRGVSHRNIDLNEHPFSDDDMSGNEEVAHEEVTRRPRRELTNEKRQAIYEALLRESVNGKLKADTTKTVASQLSVTQRMVQRIWKLAKDSGINNQPIDVFSRKPKNVGRKRIILDNNRFREVPLRRRTSIRSLASALNLSKSTLFRQLKYGNIRRHSNAIKPLLKEENKIARLQFCISMLEQSSLPDNPKFVDMYNIIHIDEKWFYMSKQTEKYYLLQGEEEPLRTCKSKNFITKVMFLAAVARPRFDEFGNEVFSGKIGIFPFTFKEPAKRNSKNRIAGTLETKPIPSVNKDICRSFIIEKLLPAIRAKWPICDARSPIYIQQDNAKPHIGPNDEHFQAAARVFGFDIRLTSQPPNSPDLNVLDLGYFSAIQSLQHQEAPITIDELVAAVEKSFNEYPAKKSNQIFLTLQSCMTEIMKDKGGNNYCIPHMGKATLAREGRLPVQLQVDPTLIQEVIATLQ